MPIYEYECKNCEHTLDALQKISEEPLVECPECGEPELKRLLSAPRFRLKGTGWYETDFKKDRQKNLAGEKEPGKAEGKADKKADDKGDKKSGSEKDGKPESAGKKAKKKDDAASAA